MVARPRPRVALLVETSRAYGRELLIGIARYVRIHGPWSIEFEEGMQENRIPDWFWRRRLDGVIARIQTPEMGKALKRSGVPVVDLRGGWGRRAFPYLRSDERAVGRLAAEHLLERGFRQFAYCGFPGADWSDLRQAGFEERVSAEGLIRYSFILAGNREDPSTSSVEELNIRQEKALKRWLLSLPRPIGVMVVNDVRGRQVLNCCRDLNLAVPDDMAVIGVDNDEVFCDLSDMPLTSVILNAQLIGHEAASLLDRLMQGERVKSGEILIPPRGVATRHSTDALAIEDRKVAAALHIIRERSCEGLDVPTLAKAVSLSRRVLERRFSRTLNRSPLEEILRVRLERVRTLLAEPELSLPAVAELAGFGYAEYMSRLFRKRFGVTPGAFRKRASTAQGPFPTRQGNRRRDPQL